MSSQESKGACAFGDSLTIGRCRFSFAPHAIDHIGARVFLTVDEPPLRMSINLSASDARLLADRLKIAACEAEALGRRPRRMVKL